MSVAGSPPPEPQCDDDRTYSGPQAWKPEPKSADPVWFNGLRGSRPIVFRTARRTGRSRLRVTPDLGRPTECATWEERMYTVYPGDEILRDGGLKIPGRVEHRVGS